MDSSEKTGVEEKADLKLDNDNLLFKFQEPVTMMLNPMTKSNCNVNAEDGSSFVVIGKDSMDAQTSILGSYVDIHQKSMSIDYKSMVSSMSTSELQQRLSEMLQENVKLKETLKQSNLSMKEQFTTLAMWQEELMKVHENHKEKFAETKDLVKRLKYENNELKSKLRVSQQIAEPEWIITTSPASETTCVSNEPQQNVPQLTDAMSKIDLVREDVEKCKQYITSVITEKLAEKVLDSNLQQSKIETYLHSAMKSLSCNESITSSKNSDSLKSNLKCSEACSVKDKKIACLIETIALVEEKLQSALTTTQLHDSSETFTLNHEKFIQSMNQYNDIIQELTKCFIAQIVRSVNIEKILKDITDILIILDNDNPQVQIQEYREKLSHFCKQLADEQVKVITDRQILIKSQDQLQKILFNYNSTLHELKITLDENAKLNVLKNNTARESLQRLEEMEQIKRDQQSLEKEKRILDEEKNNLKEEKKLYEDDRKSLINDRILMDTQKKLLTQEKISLNEEKTSLDHQSQLYEDCEKALQNEKKILQCRYNQLSEETNKLRHNIEEMNTEHKKILMQLAQSAEENDLLRSQLTIYEEDFQAEKKLKESLLEEKNKLDTELQKQVEFNKQLQKSYKQPDKHRITSEQTSENPDDDKCDGHMRSSNATRREKQQNYWNRSISRLFLLK